MLNKTYAEVLAICEEATERYRGTHYLFIAPKNFTKWKDDFAMTIRIRERRQFTEGALKLFGALDVFMVENRFADEAGWGGVVPITQWSTQGSL